MKSLLGSGRPVIWFSRWPNFSKFVVTWNDKHCVCFTTFQLKADEICHSMTAKTFRCLPRHNSHIPLIHKNNWSEYETEMKSFPEPGRLVIWFSRWPKCSQICCNVKVTVSQHFTWKLMQFDIQWLLKHFDTFKDRYRTPPLYKKITGPSVTLKWKGFPGPGRPVICLSSKPKIFIDFAVVSKGQYTTALAACMLKMNAIRHSPTDERFWCFQHKSHTPLLYEKKIRGQEVKLKCKVFPEAGLVGDLFITETKRFHRFFCGLKEAKTCPFSSNSVDNECNLSWNTRLFHQTNIKLTQHLIYKQ